MVEQSCGQKLVGEGARIDAKCVDIPVTLNIRGTRRALVKEMRRTDNF
jgi:hypothetical protein